MRGPAVIALGAFAMFAGSLFLPSADVVFLKDVWPLEGWRIVFFALSAGFEALVNTAQGVGTTGEGGFYIASLAVLFNLLFLAMPMLLFRGSLTRRSLAIAAGLCCIGLTVGSLTPAQFGKDVAGVEIGFYVWLGAYGILLCALALAWVQAGANDQ